MKITKSDCHNCSRYIAEMVRAPCCDKMGLKKGQWTHGEDQRLISYILQNGHPNWRALPKLAGWFSKLFACL